MPQQAPGRNHVEIHFMYQTGEPDQVAGSMVWPFGFAPSPPMMAPFGGGQNRGVMLQWPIDVAFNGLFGTPGGLQR